MSSMEDVIKQQKKQCIFCKIISGEIPSVKIHEDNLVIAIMDINPAAPGHILLMPKEHYPIAPIIPQETFQHMIKNAKYIARAAKKATGAKRASFFIANGGVAGQQSTHFMMHIIPRNNELPFLNAEGDKTYDVETAANLKERLGKIFQPEKKTKAQPENKQKIAEMFNTNKEFRDLLLNNTEQLKNIIESKQEWAKIFEGIDIDALSQKLREIHNG
jgi:histidine triad (HIT) family protein